MSTALRSLIVASGPAAGALLLETAAGCAALGVQAVRDPTGPAALLAVGSGLAAATAFVLALGRG